MADGSLTVSVGGESVQDPARVREILSVELDPKLRRLGQSALLTA